MLSCYFCVARTSRLQVSAFQYRCCYDIYNALDCSRVDFPGVVKHVKLEPNTILAALVAFGLVLGLGYLVQARRWHVGEGSKMRRKQLFLMSDAEERASGNAIDLLS